MTKSITLLSTLAVATLFHTSSYAMEVGGAIATHGTETSKTAPKSKIFYGKILEIHDAMGYKYLKVNEENGKELWIAISSAPVAVGERIGYDKNTIMKNFKSKTLKRNFDAVVFASDVYLAQKTKKPATMKEMLALETQKTTPKEEDISKSKPFVKKEAYTIEEIHLWKANLAGKTINIKAKVSKVSKQIMKLDWVHLGDGSGNEKMLTNDLVFTASTSSIKAGDSVIATGKVIINKDFGFGYFYPVLIQEATFKVQ